MRILTACYKLMLLYSLVIIAHSCSDPTLVGSDLLDDIKANVNFTDTVSIVSSTIDGPDSTLAYQVYNPFSPTPFAGQLANYLVGNFDDPLYGKTSISIYTQPRLGIHTNTNSNGSRPDYSGSIFDSIVLLLPYDTLGLYGDINQEFTLEVYRVVEDLPQQTLFDNDDFLVNSPPIGSKTFTPDTTAQPFFFREVNDSSTLAIATFRYLTIRLDDAFGQELFDLDTTAYENEETFLDIFKGLQIKAVGSNNAALSFDLSTGNESINDVGSLGGLYMYYTKGLSEDGEKRQFYYNFWSRTVRTMSLDIDKENSLVSEFISNPSNDTIAFIRGISQVRTKIVFPHIDMLKNSLLNKAELIFSIRDYDNDPYSSIPPLNQVILFQKSLDGNEEFLEDLRIVAQSQVSADAIPERFGGVLISGENGSPDTYKVNITAALQNMIDGTIQNEILIGSYNDIERANHTVLYGSGHAQYPMQLNVTFIER